jgi:hypothetical protein
MEQARLAAMLTAALTATTFTANAQDGDVAAGRTFARDACESCHVVEPTNASPPIVVIGPNFQDIANTSGMTATALRVGRAADPRAPSHGAAPTGVSGLSGNSTSFRPAPIRSRNRSPDRFIEQCP